MQTKRVRSTLFPRWWRNPIRWWKLRHLRHDVKHGFYGIDPALHDDLERIEREVWEREERAFLFGEDR